MSDEAPDHEAFVTSNCNSRCAWHKNADCRYLTDYLTWPRSTARNWLKPCSHCTENTDD